MQKVANGAIIKAKEGWLCCPICGKKIFRLTRLTRAENLEIYCRHYRQTAIVNIVEPEPMSLSR